MFAIQNLKAMDLLNILNNIQAYNASNTSTTIYFNNWYNFIYVYSNTDSPNPPLLYSIALNNNNLHESIKNLDDSLTYIVYGTRNSFIEFTSIVMQKNGFNVCMLDDSLNNIYGLSNYFPILKSLFAT